MGQSSQCFVDNNMSEEIIEKFYGGDSQTKEAFEELCAMVHNLQSERDQARETAKTRVTVLREANVRLRERNARLKSKYAAMVDAYNNLSEEAKDRSDSSSSDDDDGGDDECCIM